MHRNHYHLTFDSRLKSTNPLIRLFAFIITLVAIPFIFIAFTGLIAFLLIAFVCIAAAAVLFFKILAPGSRHRDTAEVVTPDVSNRANEVAMHARQSGEIKNTTRRKPVVIEQEQND